MWERKQIFVGTAGIYLTMAETCSLCRGDFVFKFTFKFLCRNSNLYRVMFVAVYCRSGAGDVGKVSSVSTASSSKQTVSNVDLLDGLVTTPPQPVGFFTGQPVMGGMSQMYFVGQQPGIVPMMAGNPAGMMHGSSAGLVPPSAAGMMAGFSETMMQGNSSTVMQMNMGVSIQQQNVMTGMSGAAAATSHVSLLHAVSLSSFTTYQIRYLSL